MISIGTTPDINLGGLSDAESLSSDENYSNEEGDTFPEYDLLRVSGFLLVKYLFIHICLLTSSHVSFSFLA